MKRILRPGLILAMGMLTLGACQKHLDVEGPVTSGSDLVETKANGNQVFRGPWVTMGDGMVRSFAEMTTDKMPVEFGVELKAGALENLPQMEHENNYEIPIHEQVKKVSAFDHIDIGWNPHGHEPQFLYGAQHFDFHFYMISRAEQRAIPPYSPGSLFDIAPPPGYLPAGYFNPGGGVPNMGAHWLDAQAPELGGQPFTKTFIYGTYDGRVIFYEPMITLAYLLETASATAEVKLPQKFAVAGYYPSKYHVYKNGSTGNHVVSFTDFQYKQKD